VAEELAVLLDQTFDGFGGFGGLDDRWCHGGDGDRAAGVDLNIDFVSDLEPGKLEQGGIEDEALGVADLADGLDHGLNYVLHSGLSIVRVGH